MLLFFLLRDGQKLSEWLGMCLPIDENVYVYFARDCLSRDVIGNSRKFLGGVGTSSSMGLTFLLIGFLPLVSLQLQRLSLRGYPSWAVHRYGLRPRIYLGSQSNWIATIAVLVSGLLISLSDNFVRMFLLAGDEGLHRWLVF